MLRYVDSKADLRSLALVSSTFRDMAQRILFARIEFCGLGRHEPTKKEKAKFRRIRERFTAISKSSLAAAVKVIVLKNWSSGNADSTVWETTEAIYAALLSFTRVHTIVCADLLMKSTHLQSVLSLPMLRKIEFMRCFFPFDDQVQARLEEVVIISPWSPVTLNDQALATSITTLLVPSSLRVLDLRAICVTPFLLPMLENSPEFPRLRDLRVNVPADRPLNILLPLLNLCPSLRRLVIARAAESTHLDSTATPLSYLPVIRCGAVKPEAFEYNWQKEGNSIEGGFRQSSSNPVITRITFRNNMDYDFLFNNNDESFGIASEPSDISQVLKDLHSATNILRELENLDFQQDIQVVQSPESDALSQQQLHYMILDLFPQLESFGIIDRWAKVSADPINTGCALTIDV
jgi:hypothetical protein